MSDQDPVTGRPVTPPTAPVPPTAPATGVPTTTTSSGPTGQSSGGGQGTTDQAKVKAEQAKDMATEKASEVKEKASAAGGAAAEHAGQVGESARAHAGEVAEEAKRQVTDFVGDAVGELRSQVGQQTDRAAEFLQGLSDQLNAMARGEKAPEGPIADVLQQGAQRVEDMASRLRTGGWEMAAQDVQRFARRRPGVFLGSAFGLGLAAGRLFRNVDRSHLTGSNDGGQQGGQSGSELDLRRSGTPAPATTGTAGTGTATTGLPGAPTMGDADPLVAGDPTGVQGGPR